MSSRITCSVRGSVGPVDHGWGKTAAHNAGWFESRRDRTFYCPEHVPAWVADWRARNAAQAEPPA